MRSPGSLAGDAVRALRTAVRPQALGVGGLYLFAASAWLSPAAARVGLVLMILAALGEGRVLVRHLRGEPLAWAAGFWVLAVLVSFSLAGPMASRATHGEAAVVFLWLSAFPIVAWWVRGDPQRIWAVLALALAGFLLRRALHLPQLDFAALAGGLRSGVGLPEIATAEYAAIALTGLLLAGPRLWQGSGRLRRVVWRVASRALWLVAGAFLVLLVLVTQSRAAWMLMAVVLPAVAVWLLGQRTRAAGHGAVMVAGVAGVVAILPLVAYFDVVAARFAEDTETVRRVLEGDWSAVPYTSGGLRVHLWRLGAGWWAEAPWLGNGPAASPALIRATGVPLLQDLHDVHNVALDLMVRLGLAGLFAYVAMLGLALRAWVGARHRGRIPSDLFLIVLAALSFDVLAGLTNCRTLSTDGRFFWLLFVGIASSVSIGAPVGSAPPTPARP